MQVMILNGPILPTMLRLAWPTIVVLVMQTLVGIAEVYFVGFLGTTALAGVTLVFPALMLMTMVSNGGIGGGVSSAIGRAIGAGRNDEAEALVLHAFVLAIAFGLLFTAGEFAGGRVLYRLLGGTGEVLAAALAYANIVFGGAIFAWITSLLAAALRGSGNVIVPAAISAAGFFILIPLSPSLIFGLGPMPRLGVAGAGTAVVAYFAVASFVLIAYLRSRRNPLRLSFALRKLRLQLFRDILGVGAVSAIGALQTNLTVAIATGIVGIFGADAIAGYGLASRLDYLQIPLLFGLGTAIVTMVATNTGAGNMARAYAIAWRGALVAFIFTEGLGLLVAVFPHAWLGLFTHDPSVLAAGTAYLHAVAPFYGMVGAGLLLYFAGQGLGKVVWLVFAGTLRLAIAAGAGFLLVVHWHQSLASLFSVIAIGYCVFGAISAIATYLTERRRSLLLGESDARRRTDAGFFQHNGTLRFDVVPRPLGKIEE